MALSRGQQTLPVKSQVVNILGFKEQQSLLKIFQYFCFRTKTDGQYIPEKMWLYSNKVVFMDTEIGIACNFHVSQILVSF